MTRIIAGTAKGARIVVPDTGTRPTADRVREAVFSAVHSRMDMAGARVLDLYAGSGAMGLEALSRGAHEVVLVESDGRAARTVDANIRRAGPAGASVRRTSVAAFLRRAPDRRYHLVFVDPPYDADPEEVDAALRALDDGRWLEPGALVVVERAARSAEVVWPAGWRTELLRRYGNARIQIASC